MAPDSALTTSPERAVLDRYLAAIRSRDLDAMAACFAEEAVWRLGGQLPISGTWQGRDAIINGFFATARSFLAGPTEIEVTGLLQDGDRLALEWTSRNTTIAGDRYENNCAGIFTVRDGLIVSVHEYMDTGYAERAVAAAMAR